MKTDLSSRQVSLWPSVSCWVLRLPYAREFAGRDAWICTPLAIPVGVSIWLWSLVQKMFPGRNVLEVSQLVMGRPLGLLAYVLYLALLFLVATLYLYDLMILLHSVLLYINKYYLNAIIILSCSYGLYRGVTAIARLVELMVGLILFFLLLSFFILIICCADSPN